MTPQAEETILPFLFKEAFWTQRRDLLPNSEVLNLSSSLGSSGVGWTAFKKPQYPLCQQNQLKWNPWAGGPDISIFINTQVIPGSGQGCEPPDLVGEERASHAVAFLLHFGPKTSTGILKGNMIKRQERAGDFSPLSNNKVTGISGGRDFLVSREAQKILFRNLPWCSSGYQSTLQCRGHRFDSWPWN